jgi:3',5'-cyclic AMP phosphodiesterase CpdA
MTEPIQSPLTLIHFGDLHVWNFGLDGDFAFKRLLGLANLALRRARKFPAPLARMFVEQLEREEADFVLFTGDLTTTALKREFAAGRDLVHPLVRRWEDRFIAIPGNHDRYTHRATHSRLFETHFQSPHGDLPFAVDLNDQWTLVAFDCAVPRRVSSRGHVSPQMMESLEQQLAEQHARGRSLIAAGHYPLLYPGHHKPGWEHILPQRDEVLRLLQAHGVQAYLHGHVHHRWRLDAGGLTHLNCGSSGLNGRVPARRPGYLKLTLGEDGLARVEMHWLQPIPHHARNAEPQDWVSELLDPGAIQE